jgi:hypothetical protein
MNPPNVETNPFRARMWVAPISPVGSSLLIRANEGRTLHAFGEVFVVLLDGKQTGEKFTAFLSPPGGGPGPHYHEREDEWFYIVAEAAEEWAQPECDMGRMRAIAEKYGHHHLA